MTDPRNYWPVYKGASFDLWTPDTGTYYASVKRSDIVAHLQRKRLRQARYSRSAFFGRSEDWLRDETTLPCRHARIVFRDVTRATDRRTAFCALIPRGRVAAHKAPYLVYRGPKEDEAYLLGVMSSIPFDWCARRFVELSMTFTILNNLPIPDPPLDSPIRHRIIHLAGRLAAQDERFGEWAEQVGVPVGTLNDDPARTDAIYELDALVAHLYELTADELAHIFETFRRGWDYHDRLTRVLEHFRNWERHA